MEGGTWALLCRLIEERRGRAAIGPGGRSREGVAVGMSPGGAEGELQLCPLARCVTLIGWLEALLGDPEVRRAGGRGDEPGLRREEAALRQMWSSLSAGEVSEAPDALRLCALLWHAGDPGRREPGWGDALADGFAGGLGGVGGGDAMDAEEDEDHWIEAVADEVEAGGARRHDLWMQGCWHAGSRAKDHQGPAPRLEAAIYGAMCGSAPLALQVCKTWEQTAWVLLRAWVHFKLDQLGGAPGDGREGAAPTSPPPGGGAGAKHASAAKERQPGGQVPWQQLGTIFAQDFGGICEILGTWGFPGDRPSQQLHRLVQMDLARENPLGMLKAIQDRVMQDAERGGVGQDGGVAAGAQGDAMEEAGGTSDEQEKGDLRFAATLVVWLLAGGKNPDDRFANWSLEKSFSGEQDLANKILQLYVIHLIDRAQHDAIPVYASNLRDTMLELVYCIYFDEMLRSPIGEVQIRAYHLAREILGEVTETIALKVADKAHNYIVESAAQQVQHKSNACEWLCKCGLLDAGHQYTLLLVKEIAMRGWEHYEAALSLLERIPYCLDENPLHPQEGMSEAALELHHWRMLLQSESDLRDILNHLEAAAERVRASADRDLVMPSTTATHQVLQVKLQDAITNFQSFLSKLCVSTSQGSESCEINLALRMHLSPATPIMDSDLADQALQRVLREVEFTNEIIFKASTAYAWTGAVVGHASPEEPIFQLHLTANLVDGGKEEALCLLAASALKFSAEGLETTTLEYLDANPTICVDLTALHMCVPRLVSLVMQLRAMATVLGLADPCPGFLNQVAGSGEETKLDYFLTGSEMQEVLTEERKLVLNSWS